MTTADKPLHPLLQADLDAAAGAPPLERFLPAQIRSGDTARYAHVPRPEVGAVEELMIDGPRGMLRLRIYRPSAAGPAPLAVFFHGSGFVICNLETHDALCRAICLAAGAVVVSVDYGLAPEAPFPAGPDDALAATLWAIEHAPTIGGDPGRVALIGDSAGGTMAIVAALRLRDQHSRQAQAMFLMYPVTNFPDPEPESYRTRGTGCGLTASAMRWFWGHYLQNSEEAANPHASPLRASSLGGLPPTYVLTADHDPLRDEGEAFAARLDAEGVRVQLLRYADMNHGFMQLVGLLDRADEALQAAIAWLKPHW